MRTIFVPLIGRWGNLLFIYAHARAWCEQNGCRLSTYPWVGEQVLNIPEAVRPENCGELERWPERMYQDQGSLIYTRQQVRDWFSFQPAVLEKLRVIQAPVVLCDVREGHDYVGAGLVMISRKSYVDECARRGHDVSLVEWESDLQPTRLPCFTGDVTAAGLGTTAVSLPAFYRMMTAKVHFRANSTFSWWAATLGQAAVVSPIIKGMRGGVPDQYCEHWVDGNWPVMAANAPNTDLHLVDDSGAA